jgi:hypothetical protein
MRQWEVISKGAQLPPTTHEDTGGLKPWPWDMKPAPSFLSTPSILASQLLPHFRPEEVCYSETLWTYQTTLVKDFKDNISDVEG